jgi:hypothetical protein
LGGTKTEIFLQRGLDCPNQIEKSQQSVIPGRAKREPGIHNHDREYGFRACAKWRIHDVQLPIGNDAGVDAARAVTALRSIRGTIGAVEAVTRLLGVGEWRITPSAQSALRADD